MAIVDPELMSATSAVVGVNDMNQTGQNFLSGSESHHNAPNNGDSYQSNIDGRSDKPLLDVAHTAPKYGSPKNADQACVLPHINQDKRAAA